MPSELNPTSSQRLPESALEDPETLQRMEAVAGVLEKAFPMIDAGLDERMQALLLLLEQIHLPH
jgi:hypothetical protein